MRTCDTCHWYLARRENTRTSHYCTHPMNISPIVGAARGAYDARSQNGPCGPKGDLHSSRHVDAYTVRRL